MTASSASCCVLAIVEAKSPIPSPERTKRPESSRIRAQVAANRHLEPPVPDDQHLEHIHEGQDDIRQDLAQDEFPRADGRHDQLLDRAALTFTDDRGGRQHGRDERQDHADDAGMLK